MKKTSGFKITGRVFEENTSEEKYTSASADFNNKVITN